VNVVLLYFAACPNWQLADGRLQEALVRAGRTDVRVERHEVATSDEGETSGFRGSPTVLVDGRDPFAEADAAVGLSCRVYRSAAGLAGAPTVEQLLKVLR
jgi:hypothetical protein